MRLDWIMLPALQYAVLGAGLGLCIYLFWTLKMEIAALEQRGKSRETALADAILAVQSALDKLYTELRGMEEQTGMLVPPAPTSSGLNMNKRGQALKMHRRGQSREQISGALGLPLTEIDLLLKVHQIVLGQVS